MSGAPRGRRRATREAPSCEAPSCAQAGGGDEWVSVPVLSMWVPGQPRPKQSGRWAGGRFVSAATADRGLRMHRERLERAAKAAADAAGGAEWVKAHTAQGGPLGAVGLRVAMRFVFATPRAERWGMPHTSRPDADNLAKMLLDALEKGGWFAGWRSGDAAAADARPVKVWGREGGTGVELRALVRARPGGGCLVGVESGAAPSLMDGDGCPDWLRDDGRAMGDDG